MPYPAVPFEVAHKALDEKLQIFKEGTPDVKKWVTYTAVSAQLVSAQTRMCKKHGMHWMLNLGAQARKRKSKSFSRTACQATPMTELYPGGDTRTQERQRQRKSQATLLVWWAWKDTWQNGLNWMIETGTLAEEEGSDGDTRVELKK